MLTPFNPQAKAFDAQNAYFCALASEVAYGSEADASAFAAENGLTTFQWINLEGIFKDVRGFVAGNSQFAILAFRGTACPQDWMEDIYATPARFNWLFETGPEIGDIHAGFGHTVRDGWNQIVAAINVACPKPGFTDLTVEMPTLWITGHSLGAALAVIVGTALSTLSGVLRPVSAIYNFGQPRVGLHNFCNNYDRLLTPKTFRFVNNKDLVPRVPFQGWDYADIGELIHFDSDGVPARQSDQWRDFLSRTLESFEDAAEIFTNLKQDVGDHSIATYRQRVGDSTKVLSTLFQ